MQHKVNHQGVRVHASIRLTDGSILNGTVNCGMTGRIESVLNAQDSFIEFMSKTGQQRFISRHQIASVEPLDSMREPGLPEVNQDEEPYRVLGLRHGNTTDAIRAAFERLSQAYADEKWAGSDTPPEITKYASDKLRQINAAYTVLRGQTASPAPVAPAAAHMPQQQRPMFGQSAAPHAPRPQMDAPPTAAEAPERPAMPAPAPSFARPAAPADDAASHVPPQPRPATDRPAFAERRPLERAQGETDGPRMPERPLAAFIKR